MGLRKSSGTVTPGAGKCQALLEEGNLSHFKSGLWPRGHSEAARMGQVRPMLGRGDTELLPIFHDHLVF